MHFIFLRLSNNDEIKPQDRIKTEQKESATGLAASLIIDNCSANDVATIKAIAKNPAGEVSCTAQLTVQGTVINN